MSSPSPRMVCAKQAPISTFTAYYIATCLSDLQESGRPHLKFVYAEQS